MEKIINTDLKPLPNSMKKTLMVKLYAPMSEHFIRKEMNRIILGSRRINFPQFSHYTDEQLKLERVIFRNEIIEFAKDYDLPNGYYIPKGE